MTPKDIMYGRYDDVLATQPPAPGFRVLRVLLADTHQVRRRAWPATTTLVSAAASPVP